MFNSRNSPQVIGEDKPTSSTLSILKLKSGIAISSSDSGSSPTIRSSLELGDKGGTKFDVGYEILTQLLTFESTLDVF